MTPSQVPDQPVEVLTEDQARTLLDDCKGRAFVAVRDTAIIRVLIDTCIRRAELLGMTVEDVDLDQDVVYVLGRGAANARVRSAADRDGARPRYLRQRSKLGHARQVDALWLSTYGVLNASGVATMCVAEASASGSAQSIRTSPATRARSRSHSTGTAPGRALGIRAMPRYSDGLAGCPANSAAAKPSAFTRRASMGGSTIDRSRVAVVASRPPYNRRPRT